VLQIEVLNTSIHSTPTQSQDRTEEFITSIEMTPRTALRAYFAPLDERLRLQEIEVDQPLFYSESLFFNIPFRMKNSGPKSMLATVGGNLQSSTRHSRDGVMHKKGRHLAGVEIQGGHQTR